MGQTQPTTEQQQTKLIFCAKDQKETPHTAAVDMNGEFVFTCTTQDCGRFIKLPADTTQESLAAYIESHKNDNAGQVSLEPQQKKLEALMGTSQNAQEGTSNVE